MSTDYAGVASALERTSHLLESYDAAELDPLSPEGLEYRSLLGMQTRLLAEAEAESMPSDVELRLDGGAVLGNEVEAGFFSDLVGSFQQALFSAAQNVIGGSQADGGTYSLEVRQAATLRLAPGVSGSFVAPLHVPQQAEQLEIDSADTATVIDDAFDELLGLLQNPGPGDAHALLEAAGAAGNRTVRHVIALTSRLRIAQTGLRVTHRSGREDVRFVTIRPAVAARIEDVLTASQQETEEVRLEGRLVGASWPRRRFELEIDAGNEDAQIFRGRVPTSLRREVSNSFDDVVSALIEVTRTRTPSGEIKSSYRLVGISSPSSPTLTSDGAEDSEATRPDL